LPPLSLSLSPLAVAVIGIHIRVVAVRLSELAQARVESPSASASCRERREGDPPVGLTLGNGQRLFRTCMMSKHPPSDMMSVFI
jgi:hypothetical protein